MSLFSVFGLPSAKQHQKTFLCRYTLLEIHNLKDKEKNHKSREEGNKSPAREGSQLDLRFLLTNNRCQRKRSSVFKILTVREFESKNLYYSLFSSTYSDTFSGQKVCCAYSLYFNLPRKQYTQAKPVFQDEGGVRQTKY